ncbi:unnamed protein product, partial [Ectocarpus sp. 8 AP-2014]
MGVINRKIFTIATINLATCSCQFVNLAGYRTSASYLDSTIGRILVAISAGVVVVAVAAAAVAAAAVAVVVAAAAAAAARRHRRPHRPRTVLRRAPRASTP